MRHAPILLVSLCLACSNVSDPPGDEPFRVSGLWRLDWNATEPLGVVSCRGSNVTARLTMEPLKDNASDARDALTGVITGGTIQCRVLGNDGPVVEIPNGAGVEGQGTVMGFSLVIDIAYPTLPFPGDTNAVSVDRSVRLKGAPDYPAHAAVRGEVTMLAAPRSGGKAFTLFAALEGTRIAD